jgi:hypothetical protein
MPSQRTPNVTREDVKRIVSREFPSGSVKGVLDILGQYEREQSRSGMARVQLAALKLASGSVERLRSAIETARQDYRDVLSAAEYPEYSRLVGFASKLSPQEVQRVIDSDWKHYR